MGDIAKQKAAGRTYHDVHIGANGYHLFFSIPYGKRIKMGIYTCNVDTYNRLKEFKDYTLFKDCLRGFGKETQPE